MMRAEKTRFSSATLSLDSDSPCSDEANFEAPQDVFKQRLDVAFGGFAYFEMLYSACRLDLFGYLDSTGGAHLGTISRDLGVPEYSLRVLLMACCYLGLVEKVGESYSSTSYAEPYIRGNPKGAWPVLDAFHSILYRAMHRLSDSFEAGTNAGLNEIAGSGSTLYERLEGHPELELIFHAWMNGLSKSAGLTPAVLEILRPTLKKVSHLVDYGGGDGTNAISLCKHYPHLRVTIFDSASVCELARKRIEQAGLAKRIDLKEGNFLKDPFVSDVDGVMFNHIFNIYSSETNARLLRKSRDSLKDGGVALIFNGVSFDTEDGPAGAPVLSAYFLGLATGEGMVYPLKDYDDWFRDSGFRHVEKIYIPDIVHGLVIAER